jgi:hypothetical protein
MRLTSSLRWRKALGAAIGSNVRKPVGAVDSGRRYGEGCSPLRLIAVDHQLDRRTPDPREEEIDQLARRGDDRGIAPIGCIAADLLQKPVHCRTAVARQLDPYGRGRCLERNAVRRLVERQAPMREPAASTVCAA